MSNINDFKIKNGVLTDYTGNDSEVVTPVGVEIIGRAFLHREHLISIVISDGVKQIWEEAFYDCVNLKSITIPKSVEKLYANNFYQCDSIENIYLDSAAVFSSLRANFKRLAAMYYISNMDTKPFSEDMVKCYKKYIKSQRNKLIEVYPDSLPLFNYLKKLKLIQVNEVEELINTSQAEMGRMVLTEYTNTEGTTKILEKAPKEDEGKLEVACDVLPNVAEVKTECEDYTLKDSDNGYKGDDVGRLIDGFEIEDGVLKKYVGSNSDIVIPDVVNIIGEYAFNGNTQLTSVKIPNGVTSIGRYAFSGCVNLSYIDIPDSITEIGMAAFTHCENISNVVIPEHVTIIEDYTFEWCKKLTNVIIPEGVTSIGRYAFNCCSLTSINIPSSVTYIGDGAFVHGKFTEINLPSGITNISPELFKYCKQLTDVTIPDGVTCIGYYAFHSCESLTSINIPDGVTSIGKLAFSGCDNLKKVVVSNTVKNFYSGSFWASKTIAEIKLPEHLAQVEDIKWWKDMFAPEVLVVIALSNFPENEALMKHALRTPLDRIKYLINIKRTDLIAVFLEHSKKLKSAIVDELINFAIENNNVEATALLLNYTNKH